MQRQSLGSPAAKHPPPAHSAGEDDDDGKKKRKRKAGGGAGAIELEESGDQDGTAVTPERPIRRGSAVGSGGPSAERSIHLIPVLTLLCFLVLYLCSHDPSSSDMADLGVAGRLFDHTAVSRAAGIGEVSAAATKSHRSLKELDRLRGRQHQSSRKLGRRRRSAV